MKHLVVGLALLLGACGSADQRARSGSRPETERAEPISVHVELSSTAVEAGESISGAVIVTNRTGKPLKGTGCNDIFQVALRSDDYAPEVVWLLCAQTLTIPVGRSTHPVSVATTYLTCSQTPSDGISKCLPGGDPPPLPPGDYRAVLFQNPELVPTSRPVPVHLR